jgi:hypothetical protein
MRVAYETVGVCQGVQRVEVHFVDYTTVFVR